MMYHEFISGFNSKPNKMRNDIKLLKILKKEFERGTYEGLCQTRVHLYHNGIISLEENKRLNELIKSMKPKGCTTNYYWPGGGMLPRIKAINKKIKELQMKYFAEGGFTNSEQEKLKAERSLYDMFRPTFHTVIPPEWQVRRDELEHGVRPPTGRPAPLSFKVNDSMKDAVDAMTYAMQRMSLNTSDLANKLKKQNTMRTDYGLLKLLKEEYISLNTPEPLGNTGLCMSITSLRTKEVISINENKRLIELKDEMEPEKRWSENTNFFWDPKDMDVRVEAINKKMIQILEKHIQGLDWMWQTYSNSHITGFCTHRSHSGWNSTHNELLEELKELRTTKQGHIYWWENNAERHIAVNKLISKKRQEMIKLSDEKYEKKKIDVSTKECAGETVYYDCKTNSLVTENEKSKKDWVDATIKIGDKTYKGKISGIDTDKLEFEKEPEEKDLEYYERQLKAHTPINWLQTKQFHPHLYYQEILRMVAKDLCETTNKGFILYHNKDIDNVGITSDEGNSEPYLSGVYFDTRENAERAIEIIGQENLKKLLQ